MTRIRPRGCTSALAGNPGQFVGRRARPIRRRTPPLRRSLIDDAAMPDGSLRWHSSFASRRDAVLLAIAEQAQTGTSWNTAGACQGSNASEGGRLSRRRSTTWKAFIWPPRRLTRAAPPRPSFACDRAASGITDCVRFRRNRWTRWEVATARFELTFSTAPLLRSAAQQSEASDFATEARHCVRRPTLNGGWGFAVDNTADDVDNDTTAVALRGSDRQSALTI